MQRKTNSEWPNRFDMNTHSHWRHLWVLYFKEQIFFVRYKSQILYSLFTSSLSNFIVLMMTEAKQSSICFDVCIKNIVVHLPFVGQKIKEIKYPSNNALCEHLTLYVLHFVTLLFINNDCSILCNEIYIYIYIFTSYEI